MNYIDLTPLIDGVQIEFSNWSEEEEVESVKEAREE